DLVSLMHAHGCPVFGQQNQGCALLRSFSNQTGGGSNILLNDRCRYHLDRSYTCYRFGHAFTLMIQSSVSAGARRESGDVSALRSILLTSGSFQPPVMAYL